MSLINQIKRLLENLNQNKSAAGNYSMVTCVARVEVCNRYHAREKFLTQANHAGI